MPPSSLPPQPPNETIATAQTAQLIETAEVAFIAAQITGAQAVCPAESFQAVQVGGGIAAVTKASFGRKLNHVAGFGMNGPVTEADLERVEELFGAIGVHPEINLCPFAEGSAQEVLRQRGWEVVAKMSVYVLDLNLDLNLDLKTTNEYRTGPAKSLDDSHITITPVTAAEYPEFIKSSILGFESTNQPLELLRTLAEIAIQRTDTLLYFARIEGKIAGCAGVALIQTELGNVAELYIDSTVPEFRGRGVQRALVIERLRVAREHGMQVATATTWPGGVSARNLEREGFALGFTKDVWTKLG
ncbi:hypothetical protein BJY04DRAFT_185487 [Aspergillus karnatakaensis]|uniref:GNAT family N-acetyltransferase n=1 Tax=Aspergillus karnatakaensis TaxID=1810916 RepID=UPI003CCD53B3